MSEFKNKKLDGRPRAVQRRRDIKKIIAGMNQTLVANKPPRHTALRMLKEAEQGDPFKILIGTILSARSRDENTTKVVARLFSHYKNASELALANLEDIKRDIHSIGFYNVKAARIKQVAESIVTKHGGKVPADIDQLLEMPGVGRKTANCVLVYAYDRPAIPVDVHVHRISNRLGLVETRKPEETEEELAKIADPNLWTSINDTFVMFGQNICLPRRPLCRICSLKKQCRYYRLTGKAPASSSSS